MASIRVRVLEPMAALIEQGVEATIYCAKTGPNGYDAVIFSKSYSDQALDIARQLRALGRPVIFDICDNIHQAQLGVGADSKIARFNDMLKLASHITYSTEALAEQIEAEVPEAAAKRCIIPDTLDTLPHCPTVDFSSPETLYMKQLHGFMARHPNALHCVWFGKSYGKLAGLSHLNAAAKELEHFSQHHPVTLTVISNERWRYWLAKRRWNIPTLYIPWSINIFRAALEQHDVAVIPVEKNEYTAGKTINRPATAIQAGLGVIADSISSYEELRPFISLDDWQAGLEYYATQSSSTCPRLKAAQDHLADTYTREAIGQRWYALLMRAALP